MHFRKAMKELRLEKALLGPRSPATLVSCDNLRVVNYLSAHEGEDRFRFRQIGWLLSEDVL